jgi:hypothetical protein
MIRAGETPTLSGLEIDKVDIFFIDFDLIETFPKEAFLTGEEVCYLTRCFSGCKVLVGLNQFDENTFDLTLRGHPESFADLNIDEKQLDNPGLWGGESEFRPWHWPNLPKYLEKFNQKVADVSANPDRAILAILQMKGRTGDFPRLVEKFLGPSGINATAREFALKSGNGLRPKDNKSTDEVIARVTAARLSKWLERMILPGQDMLVDAPHLVSRYPSLLRGNPDDLGAWNQTAGFGPLNELGIELEDIERFSLEQSVWLSRPAWFWRELSNSKQIREASKPWERKPAKYVFAEDSSRFYEKEKCTEFMAEVESPFVRRYARYFRDIGVTYTPASSLS